MSTLAKKVLVAGFFDLLHSGHVRFLEEAAQFGEVYISVGSDENSATTKHKIPIYSAEERAYLLRSLKFVKEVRISEEIGPLSFLSYLKEIEPDYFVVNDDGATAQKREVCASHNVKYVELKRTAPAGFLARSSTALAQIDHIPLRLDIVGFYDQVLLNSVMPGSVILASLDSIPADDRSGMSSSTRHIIRKVFGNRLPLHLSSHEIAKTIFAIENPPGHKYISGVVDQLGICLPGINRLKFDNSHWPYRIESIDDPNILEWLSSIVFLKQTKPRPAGYEVFQGRENFSKKLLQLHNDLSEETWGAIQQMDTKKFGKLISDVCDCQQAMIPGYVADQTVGVLQEIKKHHLGVKLMGAGGYGYMMVVSNKPSPDFLKLSIRDAKA